MTVWNFGSINADYAYFVSHFPHPGETLTAARMQRGLGGKGANQSVAGARAGADIRHLGAIGPEGGWMVAELQGYGVNCAGIEPVSTPSGHAIIHVDDAGENAITVFPGANHDLPIGPVQKALGAARPGDWLILQAETAHVPQIAAFGREKGLKIAYSAAPFDAAQVEQMLPLIDLLLVNAGEAQALEAAGLIASNRVVTRGPKGADLFWQGQHLHQPAFPVTPVDTTGAGDTFAGWLLARLSLGDDPQTALRQASAAAALQVTRPGTAQAIPSAEEVTGFLGRL